MMSIALSLDIAALLQTHAPIAIGVSGGKDSVAAAFATIAHLDAAGHTGPRLLIHSDLGRVEWQDSLPTCERLAERLGLELVTVRRQAGDLMDRWWTRWGNNVARYANLECVKLILPWSTASMRFCTSELKSAIICRELVRRFPGQEIISVSGIRRQESPKRARAPISAEQSRLTNRTHQTSGYDWHPILDWTLQEVLDYLERQAFPLHEAYTRYGSTRVSCAFCILGSQHDLAASATCADNHDIYREMVSLEAESTFSFQDAKWLGDVAPHLLSMATRLDLANAKEQAVERERAEARIPKHLLYTKGWPTCVPTSEEADLLASVRRDVAAAVGLDIRYTSPRTVRARYEELMAAKEAREVQS